MPTILVIDDEQPILGVITEILEDDGYTVVGAANGQDALRQLDDIRPDVILTDIMMPFLSGIELCRRLKADVTRAGVPIILMSAATNQPSPGTCPYDGFLAKPFAVETVLTLMRQLTAAPE